MKGPAEIAHGPMYIGFLFNVLLHGIMVTQIYLYYNHFKKDQSWMKIFVAGLFIADSLNTVFDAIYLYDSLVKHFDDVSYLGRATWVFATDPALTGIIAGLVQLFFAWRVKVLSNNLWLVGLVVVCSLAGTVGGIITSFEVGITPEFVNFREFKWSVILWLAAECCGDLIITITLVWNLRAHKTGFQASDELIDRIIRLTMQTGLLTALVACLDLLFFLTDPTGTHLIFNFPLSKLYSNSFMSTLNARGGWNYANPPPVKFFCSNSLSKSHNSSHTAAGDVERGTMNMQTKSYRSDDSQVFVHVESHEMRDAHVVNVKTMQPTSDMAHVSKPKDIGDIASDYDKASSTTGKDSRHPHETI